MKRAATILAALLLTFAPAPPAAAQTAEDLFSRTDLQRVDLWLHPSDWAKLRAEFQTNTYYPAEMTWNGITVRDIGIRSRGRGSRSSNKPGLRVDFDRYTPQQRYLGLKSLVLDNVTQDASGVHESVAMAFYARIGIPAPRELHTRLYVNDQYAGLYVIVESVDKDMLARVFGVIGEDTQNDGYLYEFKWMDDWKFGYLGAGLDEYKLRFEPTTHESKSDEELYRPIETLVKLANQTPMDRLSTDLAPKLDIPAVIRFIAAQVFLAETDGFLGGFGVNNLYLYRLENSDVHTFIAWDADNTFYDPYYSDQLRHRRQRPDARLHGRARIQRDLLGRDAPQRGARRSGRLAEHRGDPPHPAHRRSDEGRSLEAPLEQRLRGQGGRHVEFRPVANCVCEM